MSSTASTQENTAASSAAEAQAAANTVGESFEFDADVPQVMSIIINSVYSNKELFLRELISNASDALTKLLGQSESLASEGHRVPAPSEFRIRVIPDKASGTLTIQDNGIGMTKAELHSCLGTVASSGTKKFRQALESAQSGQDPAALIGQFGLGFYSAFLVAEQVTVFTRSYSDSGYRWSSAGDKTYTVVECPEITEPGTSVVLKLRKGEEEFLEEYRLKELVRKHSGSMNYPVVLVTTEEVKEEPEAENKADDVVEDGEKAEEEKVGEELKAEEKVEEVGQKAEETAGEKPKTKVKEQVINKGGSVWDRKFSEIPREELLEFYKNISNDYDDYLTAKMWHFEGLMNVKVLLFIPKHRPFSLFSGKPSPTSTNISLYCANVLVCDKLSREIVPEWMDFVYGAISSPDFPMNVSREFLQGSAALNLIKKKLPKCILEIIKELAKKPEEYGKFYDEFSQFVKLAARMTSDSVQEGFASCLRYELNRVPENFEGDPKAVSFEEYLRIVPESQKQILVLTALSAAEARNSLYLDLFKDRYVLLMDGADDEVLLQGLNKFREIPFQAISREGVEGFLTEEIAEENKAFCDFVKQRANDTVERVVLAKRVSEIPAMLFATKTAVTGTMERIIRSQPKADKDFMLQAMLRGKHVLELNFENALVRTMKDKFDSGEIPEAESYADFILSAARLGCGYSVENVAQFVRRMYGLLAQNVKESS